jgi:glycolate oxidase iron-sulfur subunit
MQTNLTKEILATSHGQLADRILRKCVHCGFCNATCPTYQILGDELDGPRGRIYLIKQFLEGNETGRITQAHLDRCLTCRNCETTCPSGVEYHQLLDIGRSLIEQTTGRPAWDSFRRWVIRETLAYPARFRVILALGQIVRPLMPTSLKKMIPARVRVNGYPRTSSSRKVLLLEGCVQPSLSPGINHAAASVFARLGIETIIEQPTACCGALHHHTSAPAQALDFIRARIDAWWPEVEQGIEAIVSTASGCGAHIKEYGHLLAHDGEYSDKARRVSELTCDIAELLSNEDLSQLKRNHAQTVAYHPPCTLQHGQKLPGIVEKILDNVGIERVPVKDSHLCCGSAGSYSLLNPAIANKLGNDKVRNLTENSPAALITANIGCLHHLAGKTDLPVKHWIELLAE